MKKAFINAKIYNTADECFADGALVVEDGVIVSVGDAADADEVIDCGGAYMMPGLVDIHTHGRGGIESTEVDREGCIDMAKAIPSEPGFKMNDDLMKKHMAESGVEFRPKTRLVRVDGDVFGCKVTVAVGEEEQVLECDTVLLALGFVPTADAAAALETIAPVTVIGDAAKPRKIVFAIEEAWDAIKNL